MSVFGLFLSNVPKLFWSEYSGKPFVHCIACKVPVMESDAHMIKKRIVANEAVMEMAMCNHCQAKQMEEMSEETRTNIAKFMTERFREQVSEELEDATQTTITISEIQDPEEGEALLKKCTDQCMVCGIERQKCHRYSIAGMCHDAQLIVQVTPVGQSPTMVCEKCELELSDLVSEKTRDSWDRFVEEHFDSPPGVENDSPVFSQF